MKMSRWIWLHDPVEYAQDNYSQACKALDGVDDFTNTNLPAGYVYTPWTIEEERKRERNGLATKLRDTGDWTE